jgi:hypothetical protein
MPAASQFYERVCNTWDKTQVSLTYNRTCPARASQRIKGQSAFQQYGGVALLSTTQAAHRASGSGRDPSGLGRWTWTSYQGRGSVSLKVIAAYRPCLSDGAMGTYSQHVNYLYDKNDDRCPRLAFLEDISREIERWNEAGEQVIVMLDANEDVQDGGVHQMFDVAGMREVVIEINLDLPTTSTFSRNFQEIPIDVIFATSSIRIKGGGYFAFGEVPGPDHQCLWVDLTYQIAFGHSSPPMGHRQARHLTCTDPRTPRRRYTTIYRPFVQQHCLDMRSYCLQSSINGSLSPSQVT